MTNGARVQQYAKDAKPVGLTPSVILINPKYPHNVGAAVRAASCFGVKQVYFTGDRIPLDSSKGNRLPREERMKGYHDVDLIQFDYPFDAFGPEVTPVAVEVRPQAEIMPFFEHPENPVYVFGPEDGSLDRMVMRHCHRVVILPTRHCTNLSAAVYMTLYDRHMKRMLSGDEPLVSSDQILAESRGWEKRKDDGEFADDFYL